MAEMVGSAVVQAVVQEAVSGAFSFMRNNHEDLASQSLLLERLKMAHLELKFALERSREMPITEVSLLERRMMIKRAFEECCDVLDNLEGEGIEERVPLLPCLPNWIMHAVKTFFSTEKGPIIKSCVGRFEMFAEKAEKFVRDVQSGFSLATYRFSSPLITQLLEGKYLHCEIVSGSQTRKLVIYPSFLEDYGVVAHIEFEFKDIQTPMKCSKLHLMLRLSESTDIVGISTKCLQSLEPQFKPMADVASGELAQISTQVGFFRPEPALRERTFNLTNNSMRQFHQEPLCCIGNGLQPSAKNILASELTEMFPEQVSYLWFECCISAAEYSLQSTSIKAWPILQLSFGYLPHFLSKTEDDKVCTYLEFSKVAELVPVLGVLCFFFEPDETEFTRSWGSAHGLATFTVSKPTTEMGRALKIGYGSKSRRVSKRKRSIEVMTSD